MMLKIVYYIELDAKKKLAFLFIFFVLPFSFTQKSKEKINTQEEPNNEIIVKQLKIDSLQNGLNKYKITNDSLSQQLDAEHQIRTNITNNLKMIGELFKLKQEFSKIFNNNYIRNDQYVKYSPSDLTAIEKGKLLINYVLFTEPNNSESYQMALKMQEFNVNRLTLDSITKHVLDEKLDSIKVASALTTLKKLPNIDPLSKMHSYKEELIKLLEEYENVNCIAKESFEELIGRLKTLSSIPSDKVKLYNFFYKERGISEKYSYIKKVYDAIVSDTKLYGSPGYDLPDTCKIK